jgi:hypothetical protein
MFKITFINKVLYIIMENNKRTLKINPELFKINGKRKDKSEKQKKQRPLIPKEENNNINKVKKELLKKVKDYQKNKETETIKESKELHKQANNLFENNTFENNDFEREFNKSLSFLQDLAKKNKEKKKKKEKQYTLKNPKIEISMDLPEELKQTNNHYNKDAEQSSNNYPNYSNLKNGSKPTFRELNKTQKNASINEKPKIKIVLENNTYLDNENLKTGQNSNLESNSNIELELDSKPKQITEFNELIDTKMSNLSNLNIDNNDQANNEITNATNQVIEINKENLNEKQDVENLNEKQNVENNNNNNNINLNFETNTINSQINSQTNSQIDLKDNIPKLQRITKTYKYKLGKKNGAKHVGILVKNRETQKKIKNEVGLLKTKSIAEIKNYLREKNLIKVGSEAPNDVLRKLYEDSVLSGEITNSNNNNMVYNFLNE